MNYEEWSGQLTEWDILPTEKRGEKFLSNFMRKVPMEKEKRQWKGDKINMNLQDYEGDAFNAKEIPNWSRDNKAAGMDPATPKRGVEVDWKPKEGISPSQEKKAPMELMRAKKQLPNEMGKTGDVVMQEPVFDRLMQKLKGERQTAEPDANKRAQIGKKMGFGDLQPDGRQFARIGKTPGGVNKKLFPIGLDHDD